MEKRASQVAKDLLLDARRLSDDKEILHIIDTTVKCIDLCSISKAQLATDYLKTVGTRKEVDAALLELADKAASQLATAKADADEGMKYLG